MILKYKQAGLSSMADVAQLVEMDAKRYWDLVRKHNLVEAPSTKVGNRYYYSASQVEKAKEQVEQLRAEGVIK